MRLETIKTIAVTVAVFGAAIGGISAQTAQSGSQGTAKSTATKSAAAKKAGAKKTAAPEPAVALPAEPGLYAVFNTSLGVMVVKLLEDKAPITVKNFVAIAKGVKATASPKTGALVHRPFYNGLQFHRVIKDFMIQTGDVKGDGTGNCGIPTIADEYDPTLKFDVPGKLAMANTGSPHTGNCQIFITVGKPDYLNGKHTIFGEVVTGQDVADQISKVPTGSNDKPLAPVLIRTVTIHRKE